MKRKYRKLVKVVLVLSVLFSSLSAVVAYSEKEDIDWSKHCNGKRELICPKCDDTVIPKTYGKSIYGTVDMSDAASYYVISDMLAYF